MTEPTAPMGAYQLFDDPVTAPVEVPPLAVVEPILARPTSVVYGRDKEVIPLLLDMHAVDNPTILDATHNRGVMWKGTGLSVTSNDVDPQFATDYNHDCRDMSSIPDNSFDVVAFDPPHLPAASASMGSSGIERLAYGLTEHGDYRQGNDVSPLFEPFLIEAARVLRPGGIVICKIADLVHNHLYRWQHVDFINAAQSLGMNACDVIIKCDPAASNLKSSKWKRVLHFRRAHCYWIVVRTDSTCETCGRIHKETTARAAIASDDYPAAGGAE